MNTKKNEISQSTSELSEQPNTSSSGIYIDDYSQLRLSYYQPYDTGATFEASSDDSNTFCKETCDTLETDLSVTSIVDAKEAERQKLREYYISQIPDLPHPSYTVASIISSASQRMGSVHLRYNDRIEQGLEEFDIERLLVDSEIEDFVPSDEDVGDPEYMPVLDSPENRTRNRSESSENETESETEERPVRRGQGRGRGAARGRGAERGRRGVRRGRGRGRGYNIEIETNSTVETSSNGSSVPSSNWTIQEFHPQTPVLLEPVLFEVYYFRGIFQ